MIAIPKKDTKKTDKYSADLPTVITNWSQAAANFNGQFEVLVEVINTIEQQPNSVFSANCKPPLNKPKEVVSESIQVLEQLVIDMSGQHTFKHPPQVSIDRLHSHTVRLQEQTERIHSVLRSIKMKPVYTTDSKVAWA